MSEKGLALPEDISAQLDRVKAGGLIESAAGGLERSMDSLVQGHLAQVAMLEARGDTAPERPFYIFNPDTGLLINYAYRHDEDPAKTGLFADVVELDEDGKPRQGVSVVNPFQGTNGFINVNVGENSHGFTPSFTTFEFDPDDPLNRVPPNIETANLLALLGQDAIAQDESLEDFVKRRESERATFRAKVGQYQNRHFPANLQAITERTNPDLHLIISDRADTKALADASRSIGLYPLIVSGDHVLEHIEGSQTAINPSTRDKVDPELGKSLYMLLHRTYPNLQDWLKNNLPAFVTVDLPQSAIWDGERNERFVTLKKVEYERDKDTHHPIPGTAHVVEGRKIPRRDTMDLFLREALGRSPTFAQLQNNRFHDDAMEDGLVKKQAHGLYYHIPVSAQSPVNLEQYTDCLRKVKLDLAMTMYLRGLNQL